MMDWPREIAIATMVGQKVAEADVNKIWSHFDPESSASEEDIFELQNCLGFELAIDHRDFLLHANGWKSFYHSVDIFCVSDFLSGPRCERLLSLFNNLEETNGFGGFSQKELLPIAVSMDDIDFFMISKPNSHDPGAVIWFAGEEVDRFPNFGEWFLAMVDYNRRTYQKLTGGKT